MIEELDIFVSSPELYPSEDFIILYDAIGIDEVFEDCQVYYRSSPIKEDILEKFKELTPVDKITILGIDKNDSFYQKYSFLGIGDCCDLIKYEAKRQDKNKFELVAELLKDYKKDQFEHHGSQDNLREILREVKEKWN